MICALGLIHLELNECIYIYIYVRVEIKLNFFPENHTRK